MIFFYFVNIFITKPLRLYSRQLKVVRQMTDKDIFVSGKLLSITNQQEYKILRNMTLHKLFAMA